MTKQNPQNIYQKLHTFAGSKKFFWLVILFFIGNALWIAYSYAYPMIYDEYFHMEVTKIFSYQFSPLISHQPQSYDILGSLSHGGATLYHYVMSYPLRFIRLFTDSYPAQILFMRTINILLVVWGLWLFAKLFREIGIRGIYINIALLFFVLLPMVPLVAAHVNYDNMLFPLTALFFLLFSRILTAKKIIWTNYVWLVVLGCITSLVKVVFLPVFAASLIYLGVFMGIRYGKAFLQQFNQSIRKTNKYVIGGIVVVFIVATGAFATVYVQNVVRYHALVPGCERMLGAKRCSVNFVTKRSQDALAVRDQVELLSLPDYTSLWFSNMVKFSSSIDVRQKGGYVPLFASVLFFTVFACLAALAYSWRSIKKNSTWYYLAAMTAGLVVLLFLNNHSEYLKYHQPYATQPRYLLTVIPILTVMCVVAIGVALRNHRNIKLAAFIIMILLFSQGGGAVTYILRSNDADHWQNTSVTKANNAAKKILAPLVKENE